LNKKRKKKIRDFEPQIIDIENFGLAVDNNVNIIIILIVMFVFCLESLWWSPDPALLPTPGRGRQKIHPLLNLNEFFPVDYLLST
jgi:hypothetical protein